MRRATALFERIVEPGNLLDGYLKARKGKRRRPDVRLFSADLDRSLETLREKLCNRTYRCDRYRQFTIYDPKKRVISVAPFEDRVMHHAVMNLCGPVFERCLVYDSYACRPLKGTLAALARGAVYTRRYRFFVKLDVRKYFDSIPHCVLKFQLGRLFKDRALLSILDEIVDGYARFSKMREAGLPIGNLTSQYFANHYLSGLDHWIKESLHVPGYVRYMDDMVLWGNSMSALKACEERIRAYCADRLLLQLKTACGNSTSEGLPFLGFVLTPGRLALSSRSIRRTSRKLRTVERLLSKNRIDQTDAGNRARALLARTDWTNDGVHARLRILGSCSRAETALSAAAAGTTTPGGVAPPIATGTTRTTAGTTKVSVSSWPTARREGRRSPVEPSSCPVPGGDTAVGGEAEKGGRAPVAAAAPNGERSRPPALFERHRRDGE